MFRYPRWVTEYEVEYLPVTGSVWKVVCVLCVCCVVYGHARATCVSARAEHGRSRAQASSQDKGGTAPYQTVCPGLGVGVLGALGDTDPGALGLPQILKRQRLPKSQIEYTLRNLHHDAQHLSHDRLMHLGLGARKVGHD
jgi:hypothetical protein